MFRFDAITCDKIQIRSMNFRHGNHRTRPKLQWVVIGCEITFCEITFVTSEPRFRSQSVCTVACFILATNLLRKHIRGYSFQFFPLYSRICKYEFPKRSLYFNWDNFKQSVGLQGFYQFYYTLAKWLAERAHQCDGRYTSLATLYSSPSFSCV